jgi:hypothetical protein
VAVCWWAVGLGKRAVVGRFGSGIPGPRRRGYGAMQPSKAFPFSRRLSRSQNQPKREAALKANINTHKSVKEIVTAKITVRRNINRLASM